MITRLHGTPLRCLLRRLAFRAEAEAQPARLRGNMRAVIVVKAPGELFSEAVFILREDALHEAGPGRRELLAQAERAAAGYTASVLPERQRLQLRPAAAFLLGASAAVLALWLAGVV